MGGSNRGEPEGGHADRREKAIVIMCEEDVLGYGGMEAAETKEMADSMAGLLRAWRRRSNQVLVSVLVLLRPLDLSVLVLSAPVWLHRLDLHRCMQMQQGHRSLNPTH